MTISLFTFKQITKHGELYEGYFCNKCGRIARQNEEKKMLFCIPCMIKEPYELEDLPKHWLTEVKADLGDSAFDKLMKKLGVNKNA